MTIPIDAGAVVVFLLVMVRMVAVFVIAPPFAGTFLPNRIRVAIAAAIGLVVAPLQDHPIELEAGSLVAAVTYQVVVGAVFGYLIRLLLSAPVVGGAYVDTLAGLAAGGLFDPTIDSTVSIGGRIHQMATTVLLVAMDGHLLIIRGVLRSYEAAPLSGLRTDPLPTMLADGAATMMLAAVEIVLPLLVALLLTETMLGLAARAAPRLNVMFVGFAVKGLVFLLGFSLTIPLLVHAVDTLLDRSLRWAVALTGG